jgi:hypothetical protein
MRDRTQFHKPPRFVDQEKMTPELKAAAGLLPGTEAEKVYAAVERMEDPVKQKELRRAMIWEACEHKNERYIEFVWITFSHPFSDPGDFADKLVAALKESGHTDADRHRSFLFSVVDAEASEDTWMRRGD